MKQNSWNLSKLKRQAINNQDFDEYVLNQSGILENEHLKVLDIGCSNGYKTTMLFDKYSNIEHIVGIDIDEKAIDVRLTNKEGEDGTVGAPALYANIPIITIKNEARKLEGSVKKENEVDNNKEEISENTEKLDNVEKVNNKEETEKNEQENVESDVKKEDCDSNKKQDDNKIVNEVNNEEENS